MTNDEILKKALDKAEENGYPLSTWGKLSEEEKKEFVEVTMGDNEYALIIFNHLFAKAFWKEEKPYMVKVTFPNGSSAETEYEGWEYHLMAMAIEHDPIEYLARFLNPNL